MGENHEFRLTINSDPGNIGEVESFLNRCSSGMGISNGLYGDMLLAITEAVTNSIHHGNNADPNKKVTVVFKCEDGDLSFSVSDEGPGFNPETVPDPTQRNRLTQPNGRGVFIMKQLSHRCNFRDQGRAVDLHFKI